jgi:hypothetical protein
MHIEILLNTENHTRHWNSSFNAAKVYRKSIFTLDEIVCYIYMHSSLKN